MDDQAVLVSTVYTPDAAGIMQVDQSQRTIWVHQKSVTQSEFYKASQAGLSPAFVLVTPAVNYAGEDEIIYNGIHYGIYRSYLPDGMDEIELYLEQKTGVSRR